MRGFVFTIDMLYGALVVVMLFSILLNASKPAEIPTQALLQMQAKDAVMNWFYSTPDADPSLVSQCPVITSATPSPAPSCACDIGFRPKVTTTFSPPNAGSSWVSQTVCVVSP